MVTSWRPRRRASTSAWARNSSFRSGSTRTSDIGAQLGAGRTIVAVPEHLVAAERDIPEGGGVLVQAGGVEVGVFRVRGRVVAYENRCAHQGGPVCIGEIMGRYEEVLGPDG